MSVKEKSGADRVSSVVAVAVKASHEISRCAISWALTNVVRPGDCVRLLVVIPTHTSSKKLWNFSNFHSDCTAGYWRLMSGTILEQKEYISETCNHMMNQLRDIYDPDKVTVRMKVVYGSKDGVVASEAKKAQAKWVVLDKRMKKEANFCMGQLDCNIIVVKHSGPKVLRLNLTESRKKETEVLPHSKSFKTYLKVPNVTPTSSPDRNSTVSTIEMFPSPLLVSEINWEPKVKQFSPLFPLSYGFDESDSETDSDNNLSSLSPSISSNHWMEDNLSSADECPNISKQRSNTDSYFSKNMREVLLLKKKAAPDSPPLCSVCQHKTPSFGHPPRLFTYNELEKATSGFSEANFLAEGGYGCVHRGVLPDGQVVAVKQHKLASTQGDREFCSEVQALSCAQHRNVVMLIGYCVEDGRRVLVYEFICNGSLDSHLYGHNKSSLEWSARQKIAVGAARGLRYLHEECRVGCIVHRDMRPNNILVTHDFEPLVGDFGLARLQADGELGVETRIIGTFGYLAPEYAQSGQVSEKADVYSFGVVLVELLTGRKAVDINRPKGQQCLIEWARPLLEENAISELIDPCLINCYSDKEVQTMLHCAAWCLQRDPQLRPRMSQVLRMLEGDMFK